MSCALWSRLWIASSVGTASSCDVPKMDVTEHSLMLFKDG